MGMLEIILVGLGVAMDAFAVSVCKGLSMKTLDWKKAIVIALYFGIFQMLMPAIGYFLGTAFEGIVTSVDHWIAFILLALIGGNMIKEAFSKEGSDISVIGVITFIISLMGVKIGNKFGNKYEKKAEFIGGFILILIGIKILLEHLGIF